MKSIENITGIEYRQLPLTGDTTQTATDKSGINSDIK